MRKSTSETSRLLHHPQPYLYIKDIAEFSNPLQSSTAEREAPYRFPCPSIAIHSTASHKSQIKSETVVFVHCSVRSGAPMSKLKHAMALTKAASSVSTSPSALARLPSLRNKKTSPKSPSKRITMSSKSSHSLTSNP